MNDRIIRQEIRDGKYTESIIGYNTQSRSDWPTNELYPTEDVPEGARVPLFARTSAEVAQRQEPEEHQVMRRWYNKQHGDKPVGEVPIQCKAESTLTIPQIMEAQRRASKLSMGIQNDWNTHGN